VPNSERNIKELLSERSGTISGFLPIPKKDPADKYIFSAILYSILGVK